MSMTAIFVQVEPAELARLLSDPALAEDLFDDEAGETFGALAAVGLPVVAQERVRMLGPQMLTQALSGLNPALRAQVEQSLLKAGALQDGVPNGEALWQLMEAQQARGVAAARKAGSRNVLSLEKAWHGVHFLLCGQAEPNGSLLSQAVLGGAELSDNDFAGYGPPRYFTAAGVAQIDEALRGASVEAQAAARFDAALMSQLNIYPGWRISDGGWVMENLRKLRGFYADARGQGRAIVTCLL